MFGRSPGDGALLASAPGRAELGGNHTDHQRGRVLCAAVGLDALIDEKAPDCDLIKYMASDADRFERLLEYPDNIRTPVVRNGRQATVGYRPEVWKNWE